MCKLVLVVVALLSLGRMFVLINAAFASDSTDVPRITVDKLDTELFTFDSFNYEIPRTNNVCYEIYLNMYMWFVNYCKYNTIKR